MPISDIRTTGLRYRLVPLKRPLTEKIPPTHKTDHISIALQTERDKLE